MFWQQNLHFIFKRRLLDRKVHRLQPENNAKEVEKYTYRTNSYAK